MENVCAMVIREEYVNFLALEKIMDWIVLILVLVNQRLHVTDIMGVVGRH